MTGMSDARTWIWKKNGRELSKWYSVVWGLQNEVPKQTPVNWDTEKFSSGPQHSPGNKEGEREKPGIRRSGEKELRWMLYAGRLPLVSLVKHWASVLVGGAEKSRLLPTPLFLREGHSYLALHASLWFQQCSIGLHISGSTNLLPIDWMMHRWDRGRWEAGRKKWWDMWVWDTQS